jgi:uncharacterized protein
MRPARCLQQRGWWWNRPGVFVIAYYLLAGANAVSATDNDAWRETTHDAGVRWGVPELFSRERPEVISRSWSKRLTGYIAVRDATQLRYSLLLPKGNGPFPVIINYSGYDPGAIGGYSYLHNNSAMSTDVDSSLLKQGYAVLGVNARGTGCSEGEFDFLGPAYGRDGADVVEWIAAQPWSNGAVGMANWSWAGMSQVATASERPPHLKAIAPGMALTDPRLDSWAIGGVPSQGFVTGWWMFLHSRWLAVRGSAEQEHDQRCLMQVEKNFESGQQTAVNLPSLLLQHPLHDNWIEQRTILSKADQIAVPILSMESFQDEATTARAGYYQERVNPDRLWYIQTNGNHDLYESLQFRPTLLAFFDHFVKGVNNGFEKRPHVEVWYETASAAGPDGPDSDRRATAGWVEQFATYPVKTELLKLPLGSGNRLGLTGQSNDSESESKPDEYRYPVEGPSVDVIPGPGAWGNLSADWKAGSVAYTTDPLQRDVVIYGPVSADLWISSSVGDTDLQVTLTDVRPDGQEVFVQRGWLRMSARALDPKRSTPTRPWPCDLPQCIRALTPGVPELGRVELTKVAYAYRAGSRIRVWIDTPSATGENSFHKQHLARRRTSITVGIGHIARYQSAAGGRGLWKGSDAALSA